MATDVKKIFLIASDNASRRAEFANLINAHFANSTLYFAEDGAEAWGKAANVPPHVFIVDVELPKMSGLSILEQVLHETKLSMTALILVGALPNEASHVDEFVTGRLQYFGAADGETDFMVCLSKALSFAFHGKNTEYRLRFLAKGERLINEGDKADSVFIVKEGRLRAFRNVDGIEVILGFIERGEFVGEMAYINGEPRAANVEAMTPSELIEVPVGTLERVLYRRPSWSKALMQTLGKRLKMANAAKMPVS